MAAMSHMAKSKVIESSPGNGKAQRQRE